MNNVELQPSSEIPLDVWEAELRALLPTLPDDFEVSVIEEHVGEPEFSDGEIAWRYAVGGATVTPTKMEITIDRRVRVTDTELLQQERETYYHESYHLARGYSFESKGLGLLDVALEEGMATKFEMLRAGADPKYGQYHDEETMLAILGEVVEAGKQDGDIDWGKWKFYDPQTERHWVLYRVGTFLVDDILAGHPELTIEDLAGMPRDEIFALTSLEIK